MLGFVFMYRNWKIHDIGTSAKDQPLRRTLPPFTLPSGPSARTKTETTPLDVFHLMVTVVLLESIVKETLAYAELKKASNFTEFYIEELQAFIGIHIAMGLLKLPRIQDYWCTNEIISTPWFGAIMPRDRFFKIMHFLHLSDSSSQPKSGQTGYDPLYKVRNLIDHLSAVFPVYYQPSRELSIDEMMIGTRCHVSFLQYMPKKPCKGRK